MAVSPADFELYSRVTGRQIPRDRGERMKMAPEVNKFIRNREYERQDKTTLQKGADILGKTALGVGALAGLYALGGGFKGSAAANVAKAVENVAKSKPTGIEPPLLPPGRGPEPTPPPVTGPEPTPPPSGGDSPQITLADEGNALAEKILKRPGRPGRDLDSLDVNIGGDPVQVSATRDKADDFLAKLDPAPVRPDVIAEQEVNAFGVPTPKGGRDKVWGLLNEAEKQKQAENIYGEKLTKEQRMPLHRQYSTIQSDQKQPDYPADGSTQEVVDNFLRDRYSQATEESLRGIPGESSSSVVSMKRGTPGWRVPPSTPINEATRQLQAPFPPVQPLPLNERGIEGGGGGALVPSSPQPTSIVAVDPESTAITSNKVGLIQKAEELGDNIEAHVKKWWHLDNEKMGYELQEALESENPLSGAAKVTGVIVPALAKQGLINTGQTAETLYGYGKSAYEKAQDFILDYQIKRSSMGIGDGKLDIGPSFSVQNVLDRGWDRHDAAVEPIVQKVQSILPTTRSTGQVAIGENAQLNRHPDVLPGETDTAPSRLIQQFVDKRISGEGSLTPDDLEIRTDVDVRDPVNFTQLFGKRVGRGEKAKFIAGLQDRNKDVYSGASNLPKRKEGTGFKWEDGKRGTGGSAGEAATLSGAINYTSPDDRPKNPLQAGFDALREGYQEASAAEEVGRRMAEKEIQGKLFEDDDDPWFK